MERSIAAIIRKEKVDHHARACSLLRAGAGGLINDNNSYINDLIELC